MRPHADDGEAVARGTLRAARQVNAARVADGRDEFGRLAAPGADLRDGEARSLGDDHGPVVADDVAVAAGHGETLKGGAGSENKVSHGPALLQDR